MMDSISCFLVLYAQCCVPNGTYPGGWKRIYLLNTHMYVQPIEARAQSGRVSGDWLPKVGGGLSCPKL